MTNQEKYKDEIFKVAAEGHIVAVAKDGRVDACLHVMCSNCIFSAGGRDCRKNRLAWFKREADNES